MKRDDNYDVIIVGGGSAGLSTSRECTRLGLKVLLIEKQELGGTCVNVGCVPKKITSELANILKSFKDSKFFGVSHNFKINFEEFVKKRDFFIEKLNKIYGKMLQSANVDVIRGYARILEDRRIQVNGQFYSSKNVIMATGSRPRASNFEGSEFVKYSDYFFKLKSVPSKCAIIGGGYIGLEFASILSLMGSEVTLFLRGDQILREFDSQVTKVLLNELKKRIKIKEFSKIKKIEKTEKIKKKEKTEEIEFKEINIESSEKYKIKFSQNSKEKEIKDVDLILSCIGRDIDLSFSDLKFEKTSKNYLKVSEKFETSQKGIFAIGDLLGEHMLTPVAIACGRSLANMLGGTQSYRKKSEIMGNVPSVVFTSPPLATVGISEEFARKNLKKGENLKIFISKFRNLYFSVFEDEKKEDSLVKIVEVDKKVVGITIVGKGCEESIQGFAVALNKGCSVEDFKNTICVHPTMSEEIVLVNEQK